MTILGYLMIALLFISIFCAMWKSSGKLLVPLGVFLVTALMCGWVYIAIELINK